MGLPRTVVGVQDAIKTINVCQRTDNRYPDISVGLLSENIAHQSWDIEQVRSAPAIGRVGIPSTIFETVLTFLISNIDEILLFQSCRIDWRNPNLQA